VERERSERETGGDRQHRRPALQGLNRHYSALAGLGECWMFAFRRFRSRCSLHRRLLISRPFGAAFLLM